MPVSIGNAIHKDKINSRLPPSILNSHLFNNPIEHLATYQMVSWTIVVIHAAERLSRPEKRDGRGCCVSKTRDPADFSALTHLLEMFFIFIISFI